MTLRLSLLLLPVMVAPLSGQNPAPLKAGDHAPPIIWTRILQPLTNQAPPPFLGRTTVIGFFPNVSSNASSVSRRNKLIAQFANKSVNFIWITSESELTLVPWLVEHPLNGWLLLDPTGETTRVYGAELTGAVIIDSNGRIAGFTFMDPDREQIQAVLDGRALAIDGDATDAQLDEILAGRAVRLDAAPYHAPDAGTKPDIPPSYEVHISPTTTRGTTSSAGPGFRVLRGYDLRTILSVVTGKDSTRILLPASLEDNRGYVFVLVLPRAEDQTTVHRILQHGIEKYFQVSITLEERTMDVYVMTALEGKTPKEAHGGGSFISSSQWVEIPPAGDARFPTTQEIRKAISTGTVGISAYSDTIGEFRRTLEDALSALSLTRRISKGPMPSQSMPKRATRPTFSNRFATTLA